MHYTVKMTQRVWLTDQIFEMEFTKPKDLTFIPGQHIRFHHQTMERDYTPVSHPDDTHIRFCVKLVDPPRFTAHLSGCPVGEAFEISGPWGQFTLQPAPVPSVLVGTGTGVAPFVAYANSGARDLILLQGARHENELIYSALFEKSCRLYLPCISQPKDPLEDRQFHGRVTEFLKTCLPQGTYQFYLCGRGQMVRDVMYIVDDQFPDSKAFTESFT